MFNKIIIIGAGMMGSSLIWAIKDRGLAKEVKALIRNEEQIATLAEKDIVATTDYAEVRNADLVIITASLGAYENIVMKLNKVVGEQVLVAEIGSVKQHPEEVFRELYRYPERFVATHPIAGSEKSGSGEIVENLYLGKGVFISTKENDNTKTIARFWQKIGMNVQYITAKEHDRIYAEISHFVQLLAFEIKEYLGLEKLAKLRKNGDEPLLRTLRLCDSNPKMWEEIFKYNHDALEDVREKFKGFVHDVGLSDLEKLQERFKGFKQGLDIAEHKPEMVITSLIYYYLKTIEHSNATLYAGNGFRDFIQYLLSHERAS